MTLTGNIQTFSISAIGRMIHDERKTGILEVTNGRHHANIHFRNGGIIFIGGDMTEDISLGSLLQANNLLLEKDLNKALQIAKATGKRLGVVLIETGLITQKKLVEILHYQFKEVLTKVVGWTQGRYTYTHGLSSYREDIRMEIDPIRLVAEAEKWKAFRDVIPNDQAVFSLRADMRDSGGFTADGAQRVMLLINGRRTVAQLIAESGLPRLAVYKALATLHAQGLIVRQGETADDRSDQSGPVAVFRLFQLLLPAATAPLVDTLGEAKVWALVAESLRLMPGKSQLPDVLASSADLSDFLRDADGRIARYCQSHPVPAVVRGIGMVLARLLQDGYLLLGEQTSAQAVERIRHVIESLSHGQRDWVSQIVRVLQRYSKEKSLRHQVARLPMSGGTPSALAVDSAGGGSSLARQLPKLGGATIITFYAEVLRLVVARLESEIGSKAIGLITQAAAASSYYDLFLSEFDVRLEPQANVLRIRDHLRFHERHVEKHDLVNAFKRLIAEVLRQELFLLGDKSTQNGMRLLEHQLARNVQANYQPLVDDLLGFLKSQSQLAETTSLV